MSTTFMTSPKLMFTSESVTEGHPDKLCDQISDAVLDACLEQDPTSRVACETATKTGYVMLLGEITTRAHINFDDLVRRAILDIGYDDSDKGLDGNTCGVLTAIAKQSGDIAMGVDKALEAKIGEMSEAEVEAIGAGDQGMMFGYACNETPQLMPMPIYLAHKLTRRLAELRKSDTLPWLRPDGKSQVTVEYSHGKPKRVDTVLVSTQHSPDMSQADIREQIMEHVIMPAMPDGMANGDLKVYVNPTGRFVIGGPQGDAGVTGRKIIVDTYGGGAGWYRPQQTAADGEFVFDLVERVIKRAFGCILSPARWSSQSKQPAAGQFLDCRGVGFYTLLEFLGRAFHERGQRTGHKRHRRRVPSTHQCCRRDESSRRFGAFAK